MNGRWDKSRKALFSLIPGLILLLGFFILFGLSLDHRNRRETYLEGQTRAAENNLQAVLGTLRPFAEAVVRESFSPFDKQSRIEAAWDAGPGPYRNALSIALSWELQQTYDIIAAMGFHLLEFHFPDSSSFFRFPGGSSGKTTAPYPEPRFTVGLANASLRPVEGFETGCLISGYRFIYPFISKGGRPLGSVELCLCLDTILPLLEELTGGTFCVFMPLREIETHSCETFRQELVPFPGLEDFLVKRTVLTHHRSGRGPDLKAIQDLCRNLRPKERRLLEGNASFSTGLARGKSPFRVTFVPLLSLRGELVGYLGGFIPDRTLRDLERRYITLLIGTAAAFAFLALIVWLALRNRLAMETLATWDSLTGAMLREPFLREAERELSRSLRHDRPLAWIMFDIDDFKSVNDTLGHVAGDKLLQNLGRGITKAIRSSDLLARWGGDEFLVLAPETSELQAYRLAERLMDVAASLDVPGAPLHLSIGLHLQQKDDSIDDSLRKVDETLYAAKRQGRNRIARSNRNGRRISDVGPQETAGDKTDNEGDGGHS